jgi:hypothetical protein
VAVFFKLQALSEITLGLRPHVAHAASPLLLWDILRQSIDRLIANVEALNPSDTKEQKLIERYGSIADVLHILLRYLEASQASRTPSVIISPLQAMITDQAPNAEVVVWYDWTPSNYSAHPSLGNGLRKLLEEVFDDPDDPVVQQIPPVLAIMSIPAAERDNILFHSALGHEMGHILATHFQDVDGYVAHAAVNLDESQLHTVAKNITGAANPAGGTAASLDLFENQVYSTIKAQSLKVLGSWLSELLADAYAVFLLGPSPLLSLHDLVGPQVASDTHPPISLRYPLMLECLRLSGFRNNNNPTLSWLGERLSAIEGSLSMPTTVPEIHQVVSACLARHIAGIANYVMVPATHRATSTSPYSYSMWERTLINGEDGCSSLLIERLLNYVIPDCFQNAGQEQEVADLASILLSGWAVYYGEWEKFCNGLSLYTMKEQYIARQKLFNLLLKAVESSHLQVQWRKYS